MVLRADDAHSLVSKKTCMAPASASPVPQWRLGGRCPNSSLLVPNVLVFCLGGSSRGNCSSSGPGHMSPRHEGFSDTVPVSHFLSLHSPEPPDPHPTACPHCQLLGWSPLCLAPLGVHHLKTTVGRYPAPTGRSCPLLPSLPSSPVPPLSPASPGITSHSDVRGLSQKCPEPRKQQTGFIQWSPSLPKATVAGNIFIGLVV